MRDQESVDKMTTASNDIGPAAAQSARRSGFTLTEMLVVLGIIGLLTASLLGAFGYLKTTAWQSRAQSQVHLVATALTIHLQNERSWPAELVAREEFDEEACWVLQNYKLLDVTTWKNHAAGERNKNSPDRYGLLDPWGKATMRRKPTAEEGEVRDHRIQYRLDKNYDGFVDASEGSPQGLKVRASVLVWTRGPDGKDDFNSTNPKARGRYPYDDRLSWAHAAAKSEN
jgi:prepilin-type N-terminal cleavage/methylation domain-containing protein